MRFVKALLVGLACTTLFIQTAQAGFFDDLFGQEQSPQAEEIWPPKDAFQPSKPHKSHEIHHRIVNLARRSTGARPKGAGWEVFLDDPTLENGDAVMTPDGLRIFTGSGDWTHAPEDFAKLNEVSGLPRAEQSPLASVDHQGAETTWRALSEPELQTGRSISTTSRSMPVQERNGRTIRYVGP